MWVNSVDMMLSYGHIDFDADRANHIFHVDLINYHICEHYFSYQTYGIYHMLKIFCVHRFYCLQIMIQQ